MNQTSLAHQSCVPCQGNVPPLDLQAITLLLQQLHHPWTLNQNQHLYIDFTFNTFMDAMNFANKIALVAEQEGHHPDLTIAWGRCSVEIWTHKIKGLSHSDFILAAKIESLCS